MALKVIDDVSKVTSDATAVVTIESDLTDHGQAQDELTVNGWNVARDWAHSNGISGPGLGNTKLAPFAVNHKGEEIGDEHRVPIGNLLHTVYLSRYVEKPHDPGTMAEVLGYSHRESS